MQIISFPSHYQLVYISFDISSFSLISYIWINSRLRLESVTPMALKGINYKIRCVETQRNIYDFKRQFIANYVVK